MEKQRRRGYLKPDFKLMQITDKGYVEVITRDVVKLPQPNKLGETEEVVPRLIQLPELLTMRSFLKDKQGYLLYRSSTDQFVFAPFNIEELLESLK